MVFIDMEFGTVILIVLIGWVTILTFLLLRSVRHYNRLTEGITKTGLREILDTILTNLKAVKKETLVLDESIKEVEKTGKRSIQRIGITRYNPFSDTGGTQSFSLALLDELENGIVITSLYARTGNRWYVKEIDRAKGKNVELSKEEQLSIKKAQNTDAYE